MHKQHLQTAYRKYAVSIGTIFENCDKNAHRKTGKLPRASRFLHIQNYFKSNRTTTSRYQRYGTMFHIIHSSMRT